MSNHIQQQKQLPLWFNETTQCDWEQLKTFKLESLG
jgi:hypothetical protein